MAEDYNLSLEISIPSNVEVLTIAVTYILQILAGRASQAELQSLKLVLQELLRNALEHGNLAISREEKLKLCEEGKLEGYVDEKSKKARLENKLLRLSVKIRDQTFFCSVSDDGAGFDWRKNNNEVRTDDLTGRGLRLVESFCDSIEFNEKGNTVLIRKQLNNTFTHGRFN